jgi:hypothetical protein
MGDDGTTGRIIALHIAPSGGGFQLLSEHYLNPTYS